MDKPLETQERYPSQWPRKNKKYIKSKDSRKKWIIRITVEINKEETWEITINKIKSEFIEKKKKTILKL